MSGLNQEIEERLGQDIAEELWQNSDKKISLNRTKAEARRI
jgi:hypothetical protein